MDVQHAIMKRKSVRSFRTDPVEPDILRSLIAAGVQAPSWCNRQPWEFVVLGGSILTQIKDANQAKDLAGVAPAPDLPFPNLNTFSQPMAERRMHLGINLYKQLGIEREDKERRHEYTLYGLRFFEAPNAILLLLDDPLGPWALLEAGIALQNIVLAAELCGLGTCISAAVVSYPDEIRAILGMPESKKIICGVAVGYPVPGDPLNEFRSERDTVESFLTMFGVNV